MTNVYMLSVLLSFVCFLGLLRQVNAGLGYLLFWTSSLLFLCLLLDEEQADWTLMASAVPPSQRLHVLVF